MDIGKYIKELLFIHDCVIIPGLGGFVANYRPAEVNEFSKTISPPSKSILFNRNLIHNDGLLIDYVSQKKRLDYRKSEDLVKEYADRITRSVEEGDKFTLDEIGFFYTDSKKRLQFQDELATNFLVASYGLPTVHFDTVTKEQDEVIPEVVYRAKGTADQTTGITIRRLVLTGVAASLVAAMVLIPVKTGYVQHMNFGWLNKDNHGQVIRQDPADDPNNKDPETSIELQPIHYHIIVGSFKDFSNARKLRAKLTEQGYEPKIMEASNGYYRVAVHSTADAGLASDKLSEIRQEEDFKSAWMLKE